MNEREVKMRRNREKWSRFRVSSAVLVGAKNAHLHTTGKTVKRGWGHHIPGQTNARRRLWQGVLRNNNRKT